MKNNLIQTTAAVLSMAALSQAQAQLTFALDVRSTQNSGTDVLQDRLYLEESAGAVNGNRLPSGTSFWLVFDTGRNGTPFSAAGPNTSFNVNTLLDANDVKYEFTLTAAGRIARTAGFLPDSHRQASTYGDPGYLLTVPVYGLLFDESGVTGTAAAAPTFDGAKFGVVSFGSVAIPDPMLGFGNAKARITSPLYARNSQNLSLVAVPEPATTALFAGTLLGVGAIIRRVRRNRQEAAN